MKSEHLRRWTRGCRGADDDDEGDRHPQAEGAADCGVEPEHRVQRFRTISDRVKASYKNTIMALNVNKRRSFNGVDSEPKGYTCSYQNREKHLCNSCILNEKQKTLYMHCHMYNCRPGGHVIGNVSENLGVLTN